MARLAAIVVTLVHVMTCGCALEIVHPLEGADHVPDEAVIVPVNV
jgi:hypothetical protein